MSAYLKCAEEIQSGNSEFHEAFESTGEKLKALHLKEVDWFLDHFAGSFSETLDEMNLHIKIEKSRWRQSCHGGFYFLEDI